MLTCEPPPPPPGCVRDVHIFTRVQRVGQCGCQGTTQSCQHGVRQAGRELGKGAWVVPHGKGGGGMSSEVI